jgi:hypothetical protein
VAYAKQYDSSKAFADEVQVPTLKSNNAPMTIHTINSIRGSNLNVLKQEEPVIRKAILSNVDNVLPYNIIIFIDFWKIAK